MQTGRVIGNATATVKHPSMQGWKLLLVQRYGADGRTPDGDPILAVDTVGAGAGDIVIAANDRRLTQELLGSQNTPVEWSIVGIVDP
jgi:ethanolamine utilization protein EutN